ncbi:MAG: nucleotide exchange factor GrpE [Candidatus Limnocylindria bacterium]
MDDDKVKRAEQLLEERLGSRPRTNGPTAAAGVGDADRETEGAAASAGEEAAAADTGAASTAPTPPEPSADELTRDLQRLAADFSNYRKRNEADRADFARFAKADLIAKLLDVLDGYDRALATVPDELRGQPWVEGMWLVERKLRSILDAEGLTTLDSVGKPFDPYVHEAVAHVESDEPEGTVVEEFQKAYRLHDRVIRPALVTVSKGSKEDNS